MAGEIFETLKNLLTPHAKDFVIKRNEVDHYYLDTVKADGTPEMFAAVQIKKNYVSLHLFPVYLEPSLLSDISDGLRKRMQGKSCFNFGPSHTVPTDELSSLIAKSAALSKDR